MKKVLSVFSLLLLIAVFCLSCSNTKKKPVVPEPSDTEAADTEPEPEDDGDTVPETSCGNGNVEEGEVCDGGAKECKEIDPVSYMGGFASCQEDCQGYNLSDCKVAEPEEDDDTGLVWSFGPYQVNIIDVASGDGGSPRQFRIYEPTGAEGNIPVVHFLHGFMYKIAYYDDFLTQLASHGFVVVSSQSEHGMINGDTTIKEADKVITFLNWLKQNLQSKVSVTVDIEHFGVSGHSRGGKVTNRVLNSDPTMATSFFGVDPVDSKPPFNGFIGESDPNSLSDMVQFKGESMFLGTELGPNGGSMACAPSGDNSVHFYSSYPAPSHHIIAAGVGHADMVDAADVKSCGMYCSTCKSSGNTALNQQFVAYIGGLMTAFFNATLKGQTKYEALLDDVSKHPFLTTLAEHKSDEEAVEIGEPLGEVTVSDSPSGFDGIFFDGPGTDEAIIFYPGASIEPAAYSAIMTMLAERGVDGFIIKMPVDMAVLGQSKADDIYKNYPSYKKYYLSGHSMGGAMIANYAAKTSNKVDGLFMLAAYPTEDLTSATYPILFIYGTEDGVINRTKLATGLTLTPASAVDYEIPGGNHAYFGSYGEQDGDGKATISPITQQKITVREILNLIR